jgi:hypothetical protein
MSAGLYPFSLRDNANAVDARANGVLPALICDCGRIVAQSDIPFDVYGLELQFVLRSCF